MSVFNLHRKNIYDKLKDLTKNMRVLCQQMQIFIMHHATIILNYLKTISCIAVSIDCNPRQILNYQ